MKKAPKGSNSFGCSIFNRNAQAVTNIFIGQCLVTIFSASLSDRIASISALLGGAMFKWKLKDITTKKMDVFFTGMKDHPAVAQPGRMNVGLISDRNIYEINLLLSNAFDRAVEWEYVGKNPVTRNACPERKDKERVIWEPEVAKTALSVCKDLSLLACMHLAVACTMRVGEITGLRWQFVSFGDIENGFADASLKIDSQLQRISKKTYEILKRKKDHIKFVFPALRKEPKSMLVLKSLKTDASRRTVWIPQTTASILWMLKREQEELKEELGEEYQDFDMVIAQNNGRPVEGGRVDKLFAQFILENELPTVEFHSLRHLSTTVKLLISKGDIKAVQGDTGHKQAKMVTDQYAHILDKNRMKNARKFEEAFYGTGEEENGTENPDIIVERFFTLCEKDPNVLAKLKNLLAVNC